ncbi:hypothetical protein FDUTEX481_06635 [Tolypothrix sp. PCC 7601]|nr:hypothetical protein FDUTEX481_06635 [Tolypothrix sp. PCC 7601]
MIFYPLFMLGLENNQKSILCPLNSHLPKVGSIHMPALDLY